MVTSIASTVSIAECAIADELYRWYHGEQAPQPVYIALDVRSGHLWADYDGVVGNGRPVEVVYGFERRWGIPLLTGDAANALLAEIAPLAQRVLNGTEVVRDGNNTVVQLDQHATEAEEAIADCLDTVDSDEARNPGVLPVWSIDTIGETWSAEDAGITADTTDTELVAIEQRLLAEFRAGMEQPHAVIDGLGEYLAGLRDELAR